MMFIVMNGPNTTIHRNVRLVTGTRPTVTKVSKLLQCHSQSVYIIIISHPKDGERYFIHHGTAQLHVTDESNCNTQVIIIYVNAS